MKNTSSLVLILISVGLFYTFVSPQYQKTGALRAEAGEYRNVIENVNMLIETRDRLMDEYQDFPRSESERLEKILPDDVDVVRLARDLDTMASQHGITIGSIQVATDKREEATAIEMGGAPTFEDSEITFTFVSNYPNFKSFMADLETSLRLSDVQAVSFETGVSSVYEYTVTIKTYWLK